MKILFLGLLIVSAFVFVGCDNKPAGGTTGTNAPAPVSTNK